jgi:WD40 repeat protein
MMGNDELKFLPNIHKDFIHDTAFNFYGTRMATSSSDGYVRVSSSLSLCFFKYK